MYIINHLTIIVNNGSGSNLLLGVISSIIASCLIMLYQSNQLYKKGFSDNQQKYSRHIEFIRIKINFIIKSLRLGKNIPHSYIEEILIELEDRPITLYFDTNYISSEDSEKLSNINTTLLDIKTTMEDIYMNDKDFLLIQLYEYNRDLLRARVDILGMKLNKKLIYKE